MGIVARAERRLAEAAESPPRAELAAALERAQAQLDELAEAAAALRGGLPEQTAAAVRDGVRVEAAPVARGLAEVRGLAYQILRRLEQVERDLASERYARVDDLSLLVDLVVNSWRSVDERLARIERALAGAQATVYHLAEARPGS
ncbi:MAG: hypothetical protein C4306_02740 [Thermoleophilia bacterium]